MEGKVKHNIPSIYTASGRRVLLENPQPEDIKISDIAIALSRLCRYTGHSESFYSVAEHSVRVSEILPDEFKLTGLLHDATEAYLGDMSSPLKKLLPNYRKLEDGFWTAIARKFNLPDPIPAIVKDADYEMFRREWQGLMFNSNIYFESRGDYGEHLPVSKNTWKVDFAYDRFVEMFIELS